MVNNNKKRKHRTISVYIPKDIEQPLIFFCKYKGIGVSTFGSKLIRNFLSQKNVQQLMLDYAMQEVEKNSQQNKK